MGMLIRLFGSLSIDGDCVGVYGVLLVGVSSMGVVWLMCVFNQAHAPSPEGKKKKKYKNLK